MKGLQYSAHLEEPGGFGLARIKEEGAPAHPEDIYIHCGCAKCEARWQKQLKAYNDYQAAKSTTVRTPR